MISSVRGRVLFTDAEHVVVEVGGVGLAVATPRALLRDVQPGAEVQLYTHMVVREDALALFGFADLDERAVFIRLLSVSGVGPKSALGVLSHMTVAQIASAVAAEDDAPFRRVSGIGPKTAKLIVVQLAGKLTVAAAPQAGAGAPAQAALTPQVIAALVALGWSERVSAETVDAILADQDAAADSSVPALLKRALAHLGPARTERAGV